LAEQLLQADSEVNVFLMDDSVDLARDVTRPPDGYVDLGEPLKALIGKNVPVKVYGTCQARFGIHKGEPYFDDDQEAKMTERAQGIQEIDNVVSFQRGHKGRR
jgi:uncharacterized protein involved in oxidation of intracellular sulfur